MKLKRTVLGPVLVAAVAFVSGGWLLQRQVAIADNGVDGRIFEEILSRVNRDYVEEHSPDELYEMAVDGLLRELGDPHTSFMTREAYDALRIQTTGEYGGLGIQIAERGGWVTVIAPLPGTPAERAGMSAGDRITGFLDPAIYFAHPEIELAFITLFSTAGDRFLEVYHERHPRVDGFVDARRLIYNLYPLLVHVRLFGGHYVESVDATLRRFGA